MFWALSTRLPGRAEIRDVVREDSGEWGLGDVGSCGARTRQRGQPSCGAEDQAAARPNCPARNALTAQRRALTAQHSHNPAATCPLESETMQISPVPPHNQPDQASGAASNLPLESLYDRLGEEGFSQLVHGFYRRVRDDDILGPMYPADDFPGAERRLRLFLEQYWGGPRTYSEERGHPRLRARHLPFPIDRRAAQRWLEIMGASLNDMDSSQLSDHDRAALWDHMRRVAVMMINTPNA